MQRVSKESPLSIYYVYGARFSILFDTLEFARQLTVSKCIVCSLSSVQWSWYVCHFRFRIDVCSRLDHPHTNQNKLIAILNSQRQLVGWFTTCKYPTPPRPSHYTRTSRNTSPPHPIRHIEITRLEQAVCFFFFFFLGG